MAGKTPNRIICQVCGQEPPMTRPCLPRDQYRAQRTANMNVILQVIVRHGLSAIGFSGVISDDETKQLVGAVVTIAMIAWSLFQKRDQIMGAQK